MIRYDLIAMRLLIANDIGSLNDPSRPFDEVNVQLLRYCSLNAGGTRFQLPSISEILAARVVVTSAIDAGLLFEYGLSNRILFDLEIQHYRILHKARPTPLIPLHWTHLLFDESAQATEPEALIPLSVLLPPAFDSSIPEDCRPITPFIILCGDVQQLSKMVVSDQARMLDYDCSLLGRLLELPLYPQHPRARRNLYKQVEQRQYANMDVPFVELRRNYRSHTASKPFQFHHISVLISHCSPSSYIPHVLQ